MNHNETSAKLINSQADFAALSPDLMLDAVESLGLLSDLRILALNSYENRVYQIGLEDKTPIIAKFYRPQRWTDEQILEEHQYSLDLAELEIPLVPPLVFNGGQTLFHYQGYRFALYPRRGGRAPELSDPNHLLWLGRFIGRIHALGAAGRFQHRLALNLNTHLLEPSAFLLAQEFIPLNLVDSYQVLTEQLAEKVQQILAQSPYKTLRLHGDCHVGNILWTDKGPHFVDLDDCRTGPAMQDLWMLLSGDRQEALFQLEKMLKGYREFHPFDLSELALIESLRTMRIIHYSAWLAKRWVDPAFPVSFPWFNTLKYWDEHILHLREQLAALQEPPLLLERMDG